MRLTKVTFWNHGIAGSFVLAMLLLDAFGERLAAALGTTPKIAETMHWRVQFGDSLLVFIGALAMIWIQGRMPPLPTSDHDDPPSI